MPKIGIVLSGCGVMDGSEIHESVLTLLAVRKAGAEPVFMAPNVEQAHVINHLKGEETTEKRNVLVEAARIARGEIQDVAVVKAGDIDALIFPGGYGAAKNLCTFAFKGPECEVNEDVARLVKEMHGAKKPIGAICISPALMGKIFEGTGMKLTIGKDEGTAGAIEKMGQKHVVCEQQSAVVDKENKMVTTPAYMLPEDIVKTSQGIEKLVQEVIGMIGA